MHSNKWLLIIISIIMLIIAILHNPIASYKSVTEESHSIILETMLRWRHCKLFLLIVVTTCHTGTAEARWETCLAVSEKFTKHFREVLPRIRDKVRYFCILTEILTYYEACKWTPTIFVNPRGDRPARATQYFPMRGIARMIWELLYQLQLNCY